MFRVSPEGSFFSTVVFFWGLAPASPRWRKFSPSSFSGESVVLVLRRSLPYFTYTFPSRPPSCMEKGPRYFCLPHFVMLSTSSLSSFELWLFSRSRTLRTPEVTPPGPTELFCFVAPMFVFVLGLPLAGVRLLRKSRTEVCVSTNCSMFCVCLLGLEVDC